MNKTTAQEHKQLNDMFTQLTPLVGNLYGRWLDEREFEVYAEPIVKVLPADFRLIKMQKKPFGFQFQLGTNPSVFAQ
jgi:hypothetical protein